MERMNAPAPKSKTFVLSPTHEPLLLALARYRYLTQRQIKRLLYGTGSRSYPSERLRPLVAAGYVAEKRPPRPTRAGSTETVYFLAGKGRSHVEQLDVEIPERFRPSEEDERTYEHYAHALAIIDVFITIDLLARDDDRFRVEAMLPDRVLKHRPMTVTVSVADPLTGVLEMKPRKLIPDAFLLLRYDDGSPPRTFPILLELDRGTQQQRAWREKIRAYLAALDGPYQSFSNQQTLTIAIATPEGDARVKQLLAWTEAELTSQERADDAGIFLVTGVDPAESAPASFLLSPVWRSPFARQLAPLLELPGGV